ncbi:hypothetical protein HBI49_153720 [Parastagonospora nodorum]|nr:hypothetical protein HBI49_153720 [Parastagonospora nodorum]KAH5635179.1 hypothetical protein HBI51_172560 [Parastagonospora nodorum]KAH5743608.1 hypothetical protein HBI17_156530 [Parastagonospora nodorum]KAH6453970.1 hypothetical protein HBI57_144270 [Parastagonospora nodorum]KAH6460246.1 hypothetical protein HBI58_188650 [Parastagonospora nodorum]
MPTSTEASSAAYLHPRSNFCYRFKVTLRYVNTDGLTPNNSTIIKRVEKTDDWWEYAVHPDPYFKLNTSGRVSGMVQVIREDMEGELHIGSPVLGRSRRSSMRVRRHL